METAIISVSFLNDIVNHLRSGGTYLGANLLANGLVAEAGQTAARMDAIRAEFQAVLDVKVAEVQADADARIAAMKSDLDAALFSHGAVVVTAEEINAPDGVDRPGVRIQPPNKRMKLA